MTIIKRHTQTPHDTTGNNNRQAAAINARSLSGRVCPLRRLLCAHGLGPRLGLGLAHKKSGVPLRGLEEGAERGAECQGVTRIRILKGGAPTSVAFSNG